MEPCGHGSRAWERGAEEAAFMARLPLAQTTVDLDVERRGEQGLLERLLADGDARVMLVDRGSVAVPRVSGETPGALDCPDDLAAPRPDAAAPAGSLALALLAAREVSRAGGFPLDCYIYLGVDRSGSAPVSYLALDMARAAASADDAVAARARRLRESYDWVELRSFAPCACARDAGIAASACALSTWHVSQRFCPACGSPVVPILAGWAQTCSNPADPDRLLFPRIEPAIITAIIDDADRIVLQNNTAWRPRFFSVSAGFVEAGESLEHAVRREAREEVGVKIGEVVYMGSQSWPFPASIMLGFRARALTDEIRVDHDEVASARWFTRDELARAADAGELELPGRASIARHLIEDWFGGPLG